MIIRPKLFVSLLAFFSLSSFFASNGIAQLTIKVTSIPSSTPAGTSIFFAGNLNNWNPADPSYKLTDDMDGTWHITFTPPVGTLEYKFTRGGWDTVEGTTEGTFRPNRTYNYTGGTQTLSVSIAGWEGVAVHTTTDNVQILDDQYYIPQLNRSRRIWIYLPPDYSTTSKRYPVFYLQDGQNIFDAATSFSGEWKVDESMNQLFNQGDKGAIIVGIDNGGADRIDEYCPYVNSSYGGGHGEAYASFIVHTLKPHIDSLFRTKTEREYTGIGGSSLGANISMYAAIEYQDVFSKVGIFSPAFWISDSIYQHVTHTGIHQQLKIYFVAGQNESTTMISDMAAVRDTLVAAGENESNITFLSRTDGEHKEWFWAREYPDAYTWLFTDIMTGIKKPESKKGLVFPNPAGQEVWFQGNDQYMHVTIHAVTGQILKEENVFDQHMDISDLPDGLYLLEYKSLLSGDIFTSRFIKL